MTVAEILSEVAIKHALTANDLRSDTRTKRVTDARSEFFYRALNETVCSSSVIARVCRKDHSTVLYGAAKYAIVNDLEIPRGAVAGRYTRAIKSEGNHASV